MRFVALKLYRLLHLRDGKNKTSDSINMVSGLVILLYSTVSLSLLLFFFAAILKLDVRDYVSNNGYLIVIFFGSTFYFITRRYRIEFEVLIEKDTNFSYDFGKYNRHVKFILLIVFFVVNAGFAYLGNYFIRLNE